VSRLVGDNLFLALQLAESGLTTHRVGEHFSRLVYTSAMMHKSRP
jgi:hypothetical protein